MDVLPNVLMMSVLFRPADGYVACGYVGERMRITSGGNVGIGTISPGAKLSISGGNVVLDDDYEYRWGSDQSVAIRGNSTTELLSFYTNNSERMRITSGGNVGIGTGSPTFDDGTGVELSRSGVATYRATSTGSGTVALEMKATTSAVYVSSRGNYPLGLETNGTERMRITSGGNAQYTGDPFIYSNTTAGGTAVHSGLRFNSTDKYIRFFTNDLGRMDITSSGEVLIGTTSDAGDYKLQVNGASRFLTGSDGTYRDWETDRKSTRLNSSH